MGTFIFYAWAVDGTSLVALTSLVAEQAKPTKRTMKKCLHFLDCTAMQDIVVVAYKAHDMVLAIHNNASCLSESQACSQAGCHFYVKQ